MKISFETTKGWETAHAILIDGSGREIVAACAHGDGGAFEFDLDLGGSIGIRFSDGFGERTSIYYHGGLEPHVAYRYNEALGRHLTYIAPQCDRTGRVETFTLADAKNFSHREDGGKKISVFVPWHYDGTQKYDVLYFFDAQNLFCRAGKYTDMGDPYGSWELDVVLDEIYRRHGERTIVVGIDNADVYRNWELFMDPRDFGELTQLAYLDPREDFSRGYLDFTSDFIRNTLHPYVKEHYCVSDDNIGIGGSSMGGLASFYCAMRELGFYSYVLSYSPAFALYEMADYERFFDRIDLAARRELQPKLHIYCGSGDPLEELLLPSAREMGEVLVRHGYDAERIFETYDLEKPHNEESWRLVLPHSLEVLSNRK